MTNFEVRIVGHRGQQGVKENITQIMWPSEYVPVLHDAPFHGGVTLHYSRGNTTDAHRRALILNFRPAEMIRLERELGFDHGKSSNIREIRNVNNE